ncbi:hypothetical protein ACFFX1_15255 [Dactylosporangium sucinum]|uniref:Uncharacterized protein n=1 Tax=Dactylosporangium sucinum TaxID=1424081 RepID=A0A917UF25_9ACTN|nr:hypothetical protein [Dactylosporangium sucinum]GGM88281.1 hypothetical protein GCM10007977_107860 [Dactylosporangium sucinum]
MEKWVAFRRSRIDRVVAMVRAVAEAADPGEHGEGVEVVVEAPRKKWWQALFNHDNTLAQARIVVTRAGGEVRYPFDIQLITAYGGNAAHRLGTRPGWAVSNSAGLAFVIQKGTGRTGFDFEELTTGAVAALAKLRRKPQERGWRARVDRAVRRS